MEAHIRIIVATLTGVLAFAALSAEAAPLAPVKGTAGGPDVCPPIEQAAQDRGTGPHNAPCDERWGRRHSDGSFTTGSDNPDRRRRDAKMRVIPSLGAGMAALAPVSAQAGSGSNDKSWRPLSAVVTFGLGDQGCGDGWHQALWLDWRGGWWWGPCIPNR